MGASVRPSKSTGPNNFQNFPVVSSARTGSRVTTVKVTLEGIPTQIHHLGLCEYFPDSLLSFQFNREEAHGGHLAAAVYGNRRATGPYAAFFTAG